MRTLALHFRPKSVPSATLDFTLSWGLGGLAAVLILNQFATGVLLKFAYQPTAVAAYPSIIALQNDFLFGQLVRNLHFWGANLLLPTVLLHLLRVFYTSAYGPPRRATWLVGLGLLAAVLTANFSGYLLPWDQLAYWATTVWTAMLGYLPGVGETLQQALRNGDEIGQGCLQLFYTIHTAMVPVVIIIILPYHFWRIRKAGGLIMPRSAAEASPESPPRSPVWPDLLVREAAAGLCLMAVLMLLAVFFNAPLGDPANPGMSPNPTKAPWFMAGFQELLLHVHPIFAVMVIPLLMLCGLLWLPFSRVTESAAGVWFASSAGLKTTIITALAALIATPAAIVVSDAFIKPGDLLDWLPPMIGEGFVPTLIWAAAAAGIYAAVRISFRRGKIEAVQAVFTWFLITWLMMTVVCVWFRGAQMKLAWPWE